MDMREFLCRRPCTNMAYVTVVWPVAEIDMIHAIKYYRIAVQNTTEERILRVLTEAWQIECNTLNKPGPEVNLFRWILHTAEVSLLFAIALELEGKFR